MTMATRSNKIVLGPLCAVTAPKVAAESARKFVFDQRDAMLGGAYGFKINRGDTNEPWVSPDMGSVKCR